MFSFTLIVSNPPTELFLEGEKKNNLEETHAEPTRIVEQGYNDHSNFELVHLLDNELVLSWC